MPGQKLERSEPANFKNAEGLFDFCGRGFLILFVFRDFLLFLSPLLLVGNRGLAVKFPDFRRIEKPNYYSAHCHARYVKSHRLQKRACVVEKAEPKGDSYYL